MSAIKEIFLFLTIGEDGSNGIVGAVEPGVGGTPLFAASSQIAEMLKLPAEALAKKTGARIGLFRFKRDEELWRTI